jgi:hypothetical protein
MERPPDACDLNNYYEISSFLAMYLVNQLPSYFRINSLSINDIELSLEHIHLQLRQHEHNQHRIYFSIFMVEQGSLKANRIARRLRYCAPLAGFPDQTDVDIGLNQPSTDGSRPPVDDASMGTPNPDRTRHCIASSLGFDDRSVVVAKATCNGAPPRRDPGC